MDGNGAIDVQNGLEVSGGSLLVSGSSGMAEAPMTSSPQAWVAATVSTQAAGATVEIRTAEGDVLHSWTAEKEFASVVYSSADVVSDAAYTVVTDGTEVATATAGEFTGGGMGGGMPGGMGGGGRGAPRTDARPDRRRAARAGGRPRRRPRRRRARPQGSGPHDGAHAASGPGLGAGAADGCRTRPTSLELVAEGQGQKRRMPRSRVATVLG